MSEDAAAATTAPDPARIHAALRSPRKTSHTARAAACSSGPSSWFTTAERATA
jgi:hypothetical protein